MARRTEASIKQLVQHAVDGTSLVDLPLDLEAAAFLGKLTTEFRFHNGASLIVNGALWDQCLQHFGDETKVLTSGKALVNRSRTDSFSTALGREKEALRRLIEKHKCFGPNLSYEDVFTTEPKLEDANADTQNHIAKLQHKANADEFYPLPFSVLDQAVKTYIVFTPQASIKSSSVYTPRDSPRELYRDFLPLLIAASDDTVDPDEQNPPDQFRPDLIFLNAAADTYPHVDDFNVYTLQMPLYKYVAKNHVSALEADLQCEIFRDEHLTDVVLSFYTDYRKSMRKGYIASTLVLAIPSTRLTSLSVGQLAQVISDAVKPAIHNPQSYDEPGFLVFGLPAFETEHLRRSLNTTNLDQVEYFAFKDMRLYRTAMINFDTALPSVDELVQVGVGHDVAQSLHQVAKAVGEPTTASMKRQIHSIGSSHRFGLGLVFRVRVRVRVRG
ncbi:hypothetical protein JCM3775_003673 [Rhodotorula graminis]